MDFDPGKDSVCPLFSVHDLQDVEITSMTKNLVEGSCPVIAAESYSKRHTQATKHRDRDIVVPATSTSHLSHVISMSAVAFFETDGLDEAFNYQYMIQKLVSPSMQLGEASGVIPIPDCHHFSSNYM